MRPMTETILAVSAIIGAAYVYFTYINPESPESGLHGRHAIRSGVRPRRLSASGHDARRCEDRNAAWVMSQRAVRNRLTSPQSASFQRGCLAIWATAARGREPCRRQERIRRHSPHPLPGGDQIRRQRHLDRREREIRRLTEPPPGG